MFGTSVEEYYGWFAGNMKDPGFVVGVAKREAADGNGKNAS